MKDTFVQVFDQSVETVWLAVDGEVDELGVQAGHVVDVLEDLEGQLVHDAGGVPRVLEEQEAVHVLPFVNVFVLELDLEGRKGATSPGPSSSSGDGHIPWAGIDTIENLDGTIWQLVRY